MEQSSKLGRLTNANAGVLATRMASFEPQETAPVDLRIYDAMLEAAVSMPLVWRRNGSS